MLYMEAATQVPISKKVTLDEVSWEEFEAAKLVCSRENPESCEMCQG